MSNSPNRGLGVEAEEKMSPCSVERPLVLRSASEQGPLAREMLPRG